MSSAGTPGSIGRRPSSRSSFGFRGDWAAHPADRRSDRPNQMGHICSRAVRSRCPGRVAFKTRLQPQARTCVLRLSAPLPNRLNRPRASSMIAPDRRRQAVPARDKLLECRVSADIVQPPASLVDCNRDETSCGIWDAGAIPAASTSCAISHFSEAFTSTRDAGKFPAASSQRRPRTSILELR